MVKSENCYLVYFLVTPSGPRAFRGHRGTAEFHYFRGKSRNLPNIEIKIFIEKFQKSAILMIYHIIFCNITYHLAVYTGRLCLL